jgi:four helix bundle protein
MTYDDWERNAPRALTGDPLWRSSVYRQSLYAAEVGWWDITRLARDRRTRSIADQLYRALGSISANIAEGYSRSSGADRAGLYEYALGSARESRDWYHKARFVLGDQLTARRLVLLTSVIRMLLAILPRERAQTVRKTSPSRVRAR